MRIHAIGLFVKNMKAMVAFYRDVLGMETDWNGEDPLAELDGGSVRLLMYGRLNFEVMTGRSFEYPQSFNGTFEMAFDFPSYPEVDREYLRLIEKGAVSIMPPTTEPWGQRTAYLADPEGNLIELSSMASGDETRQE